MVNYLVEGFTHGFRLGLNRRPKPRQPYPNSREARQNPEIVQKLADKEIQNGCLSGPFDKSPLPNIVFSPLNIVPKAGSEGEFRLIHDLAYPYNNESLYSCIPTEEASVKYYLEAVVNMAVEIGTKTWGARIDICHFWDSH